MNFTENEYYPKLPERNIEKIVDEDHAKVIEKATRLNNSSPFNKYRWSHFEHVNNVVEYILADIDRSLFIVKRPCVWKRILKPLILDLYANWLIDTEKYTSYDRNKSKYYALKRYNVLNITDKIIEIIDAMESLGYVTGEKGFLDRTTGRGRLSRMKATGKLIALIVDRHRVTREMIQTAPDRECIELRDYDEQRKQQVTIDYHDTGLTRQMRAEVQAYNSLLSRASISLVNAPQECSLPIDFTDRFVRRIFNDRQWDHGGRYYGGWWQRIPSRCRQHIQINGHPTSELDYSGLHIVLLYALHGIDYWKQFNTDPYTLDGYEQTRRMREFLKQLLLTTLNSRTRKIAKASIRLEINFNKPEFAWIKTSELKIDEIINSFQLKHELIAEHFFTGYGVNLQYYDSCMARIVINNSVDLGIPILCIHDSFVFEGQHENFIFQLMETAFTDVVQQSSDFKDIKIKPRIKIAFRA